MGKVKTKLTGRVIYQSDENFDWSLYENGYTGGNQLVANKSVKTKSKDDKVFCHEAYAQDLYDMMEEYYTTHKITPKDTLPGNMYAIDNIRFVSKHEIAVDTTSGMSAVIDLNKERQYLDVLGCSSPAALANAIKDEEFKKKFIASGLNARVNSNGRISLWDGHKAKIEDEFRRQITEPTAAYEAKILSINGGGYIVDVLGVQCFLPGSLAAAGILTDFNVLLGKTIPVMIVNYIPASGFVVSYKKYLNAILPSKIANELNVGDEVFTKVTGTSKNGVFVQFKDKDGEWLFSGLIHRSVMSADFEKRFDHREFRIGDEFKAFINNIVEKDGQYRIVISDEAPVITNTNSDESEE